MNAEAKAKMTRARASLILDQPFFGTLALRLHMSESDQHKTMATDGRRLIYNPKWVNSLPIGEVKGVVAHEVMHVVYNHPGRRGAREPGRWNRACDYAINTTLIDAGFELPKGGCIDAQYKGMTADQIYNMLPPGDKDDDPDDLMDGEAEPLSPEEVRDWKVAVIQAASEAKKAGQLSNGLSRLIDDIVEPKADWRALLRQFVTERSNADYDWSRPNKRMLSLGFCLPSLYSERCGTIAVFKDISCSIDKETSAAFSAEIRAICEDIRPEHLLVLYVDTEIQKIEEFADGEFTELDNFIGGGTDFRPPFKYVEEHDISPVCAIYLTDLEGPFPSEAPYPVLWCTINELVAPFGDTVTIDI
jgi:predicted metal-dependent peptidase